MITGKRILIAFIASIIAISGFLIFNSEDRKVKKYNKKFAANTENKTRSRKYQNQDNKSKEKFEKFILGKRNIKALLLDRDILWIGTSGALLKYNIRTQKTIVYNNKNGLLSNGILCIKKINGKIWVGTYGGGLSILDGNTWININVDNGLADAFVYDIVQMNDNSIWIATWSGANHVTGDINNIDSWYIYTVENTYGGLANDWVYSLAKGKDGSLWFATEGGLSHYDGVKWKSWNHEDGLGAPYDYVKSDIKFKRDPSKESKHHARQKEEAGLDYVNISYNPNYIVSMDVDDRGRVWVGTWGGGLSVLENGKFVKTYTMREGLSGNHVFMVKEGPDNIIWAGTENGLSRFDGKGFKNFNKENGLVSNRVFSIEFLGNGSVLAGSFGGVTFFRGGLN